MSALLHRQPHQAEENGVGKIFFLVACCIVMSFNVEAQSATDMMALKGFASVTILSKSDAGRAALAANYTVTGGIQTGAILQPTLLPFAEQQQQALRDAFTTDTNLAQLADGLGTTLGAAWLARAHYIDRKRSTEISSAVSTVIRYAITTSDLNAAGQQILLRQSDNRWRHTSFV